MDNGKLKMKDSTILFQYKYSKLEIGLILLFTFWILVLSYFFNTPFNFLIPLAFILFMYLLLSNKITNISFYNEYIIIERPFILSNSKIVTLKYEDVKSITLSGAKQVVILITDNTGAKSQFSMHSFNDTLKLFTFLKGKKIKLINDTVDHDYFQRLIFDKVFFKGTNPRKGR